MKVISFFPLEGFDRNFQNRRQFSSSWYDQAQNQHQERTPFADFLIKQFVYGSMSETGVFFSCPKDTKWYDND